MYRKLYFTKGSLQFKFIARAPSFLLRVSSSIQCAYFKFWHITLSCEELCWKSIARGCSTLRIEIERTCLKFAGNLRMHILFDKVLEKNRKVCRGCLPPFKESSILSSAAGKIKECRGGLEWADDLDMEIWGARESWARETFAIALFAISLPIYHFPSEEQNSIESPFSLKLCSPLILIGYMNGK